MKTTILFSFASLTALGILATGCSFAARSPEMYRDDTAKLLETKNNDIRACYDNVLKTTPGAGGKVTVKFDVAEETGTIQNVVVDKPSTTAPDPVADCVKNGLTGLTLTPGDARLGQASFVYEFSQPKS